MGNYRDELSSIPEDYPVPKGLKEHLSSKYEKETELKYSYPQPIIDDFVPKPRGKPKISTKNIRLPSRIDNALIPYSDLVKNFIISNCPSSENTLHDHHYFQLKALDKTFNEIPFPDSINRNNLTFDINILRRMCKSEYTHKSELVNIASHAFASRATQHDMSIICMSPASKIQVVPSKSVYLSFLLMIQRLRVFLARAEENKHITTDSPLLQTEDSILNQYYGGVNLYYTNRIDFSFFLIMCGGHFRLYHSDIGIWYCGSIVYLDYMFTCADIMNNLSIIKSQIEYSWAHDFISILEGLSVCEQNHNDIMNFMKGLEGFLLNLSDYDEEYAMNWGPVMNAMYELWVLDMKISNIDYKFFELVSLLHCENISVRKGSFLQKIIKLKYSLSRNSLQELSALHKFIFYAEVNAKTGVEKFLKRVHTGRPMIPGAVKNLTRLAKRLFFISYMKKHSSPPTLICTEVKRQLLSSYALKKQYTKIDALGMAWWDDVIIFNCMDNTMTDDPLEYAKDKGAIKSRVRFGPGDSRKELLQVIEKEDYVLKDFFSSGPFKRNTPEVRFTSSCKEDIDSNDPARLIEKEREQKEDARLFGNAELENKHALSVVALKMKKALNYFDEQLMTPSDKSRKAMIHSSAQELLQPKTYSLMLDIEGHNQSMQYENTHELAEFLGNLYGETGWESISNYFGQLMVYHYDEYENKVITSTGQKGGIEGWLNPFWTLHTTLMMKLLREMTPLEIRKILVYSDDVNAIVTLNNDDEKTVNSTFKMITDHCLKFGMVVKMSQTALSKHRITMLRQHYSDGVRADSTLKKLISTSGANNAMLMSDELEIAGISSSISSAMDNTNHHETCCYLKNFKFGLLMARLPHSILSQSRPGTMVSSENLPKNISNFLYQVKDDKTYMLNDKFSNIKNDIQNDICHYLNKNQSMIKGNTLELALSNLLTPSVQGYKYVDSPDRMLYLQIYDDFLKDLLFFWLYSPVSIGGLGASLHINLFLSGHSCGFTKSIHYLHQWIKLYSVEKEFFYNYLENSLGINKDKESNFDEKRLLSSNWPNDISVTSATTSISQSLKSMVHKKNKNKRIKELFKLEEEQPLLKEQIIDIYRKNFHPRIAQFYYENTSTHFLDLLISKVETSSSILVNVSSLPRLRNSLVKRTIENIRLASNIKPLRYGDLSDNSHITEYLLNRRKDMFPNINFINVAEILYDNSIEETHNRDMIITVRQSSPHHFDRGTRVFDTPQHGNEVLYKGEILEEDRMTQNKEEYMAAKVVSVTKWMLMKFKIHMGDPDLVEKFDCVMACNLALQTLTGQRFKDLIGHSPTEIGGEILHRIPNMRFNTSTYLRAEPNKSLLYTSDIDQRLVNNLGLVDSNINFDYLRLRLILAMITSEKSIRGGRFIAKFKLNDLTGIKDVQFVIPMQSSHIINLNFTAYGLNVGHKFCTKRFRYMASHYLYSEQTLDITTIPNLNGDNIITLVGEALADEMILSYLHKLENEHMSLSSRYLDIVSWMPLLSRIKELVIECKNMNDNDLFFFLTTRLSIVLEKKKKIRTISKKHKLAMMMQSQCLIDLDDMRPMDDEFKEIIQRMLDLSKNPDLQATVYPRMAKYQNILLNLDNHRRKMAQFIACEYAILLLFATIDNDHVVELDVDKMINSLRFDGISLPSLALLCPELYLQISLVGDYLFEKSIQEDILIIKSILLEIKDNNILANMIIPEKLPSTKPITTLTRFENVPEESRNLEYSLDQIGRAALDTGDEIIPLLKFVKRCSFVGASPYIFCSPTGSDSYSSQFGLFQLLIGQGLITIETKICDLTAGRGDMRYVADHLNLNVDSFSRSDVFTQVYHHPDIRFDVEYDIFKSDSIKFVLQYQWVHVDISFTGKEGTSVTDLIFMLEENNLAYSIRLNSVTLENQEMSVLHNLPQYSHFLAYPSSKYNKPYQIYLVGIPEYDMEFEAGLTMKQTSAFRNIASGYSNLISTGARLLKLEEECRNSVSIYLPKVSDMDMLMKQLLVEEVVNSKLYYAKRFISEIGVQEKIYWSEDHISPKMRGTYNHIFDNLQHHNIACYLDKTNDSIGKVNDTIIPYHILHLEFLQSDNDGKKGEFFSELDEAQAIFFRQNHPIQSERSKSNIIVGMKKFNYNLELSDRISIQNFIYEHEKLGMFHSQQFQRDFALAVKLLILSASEDNYSFGINVLWSRIRNSFRIRQSDVNIIKIYRQLSYIFDECKRMLASGRITIQELNAIRNSLELESNKRRLQRLDKRVSLGEYMGEYKEGLDLEKELDSLFLSLSNWAENSSSSNENTPELETIADIINPGELDFDINILNHIENTLKRLGISEPNRFGYIDLGDIGPNPDDNPDYW